MHCIAKERVWKARYGIFKKLRYFNFSTDTLIHEFSFLTFFFFCQGFHCVAKCS